MRGFWDLDDGSSAKENAGGYEEKGGNFGVIPDGSNVLAECTEAKWQAVEGNPDVEYVNLKWVVQEPETYAKRVVFQKFWVEGLDPSVLNSKGVEKAKEKRAKELRNFAAVDALFGGKLAKKDARPNSDDLTMALTGQPAVIKVRVWEAKNRQGQDTSGNWVCWVGEAKTPIKIEAAAPASKPKAQAQSQGKSNDFDDGDSIPF